MYLDLHITVDEKKAKSFLAFLKELDFVEVEKTEKRKSRKAGKSKKKETDFAYFDSCPDWDVDAETLRKQSNLRPKSK